jgi:putative transposase
MHKSRLDETEIISIMKEADAGVSVNDVWRKDGINSAMYGGLQAADLKRMRGLPRVVAPSRLRG